MGKIQKNQEEELRRHLDKLTPAQVAFEKVQEKQQMERILKKASESIRESLSHVQLCNPVDCSLPGSSVHGIPGKSTGLGCHFLLQQLWRWGRRLSNG